MSNENIPKPPPQLDAPNAHPQPHTGGDAGKNAGSAIGRALRTTGESIGGLAQNFWQSFNTNIFAVITVVISAIAAPVIVGYAKHEWEYSERAASEIKMFTDQISKTTVMSEGDVEKLLLINALYESTGNNTKLELGTDKLKEALTSVSNRLTEQRKSDNTLATMISKGEEAEKARKDAEEKGTVAAKAQQDAEANQNKLEAERDTLMEQIKTMQPGGALEDAKKRLSLLEEANKTSSATVDKLKADAEKLAQEKKALEEKLAAMQPKVLAPNDSLPPNVADKDRQISALVVDNQKLTERINDLLRFVTNTGRDYWLYIGYKDDSGRLMNPRLEKLGGSTHAQKGVTYTVNDMGALIRELPTVSIVKNEAAAELGSGYRVTFSEIKEPFPYKEKGKPISPVWGKVSKVQTPTKPWYSRWLR